MNFQEELVSAFTHIQFKSDEPMSRHTTFRIGGPADLYAEPSVSEAIELVTYCRKHHIPYTVLGNGSNVLVSDKGIRGLVIVFGKGAGRISISGNEITVEAGALLSAVARCAAKANLTGLEFAAGIPGTVGGGLLMNAGAYDGQMADVVVSAEVLKADGTVETWTKEQMELSYRHSAMMDAGCTILSAKLLLTPGDADAIQEKMTDFAQRRREKQPLEFPSAGSTFKRPEGYFAGKLIMDAGLRGYQVGDAQVSEKHCGFVINKGNATAAEVKQLMADVSDRVQQAYGVALEAEVRFVGEE